MNLVFVSTTVASMAGICSCNICIHNILLIDTGAEPRACPVKRFGYMDVFTRVAAVNSESMPGMVRCPATLADGRE